MVSPDDANSHADAVALRPQEVSSTAGRRRGDPLHNTGSLTADLPSPSPGALDEFVDPLLPASPPAVAAWPSRCPLSTAVSEASSKQRRHASTGGVGTSFSGRFASAPPQVPCAHALSGSSSNPHLPLPQQSPPSAADRDPQGIPALAVEASEGSASSLGDVAVSEREEHPYRKKYWWLSLAWTQILIAAPILTLSRGTLNALNAVGGFGTGDITTATTVNMLSSMAFCLLSWLSGGIVNVIGFRAACTWGSVTTLFTMTSLMLYTMYHIIGIKWVWLAGFLDGVGSGILWTAVGTMIIRYPSGAKKGLASTVLFSTYSVGAALGGLLAFATNIGQRDSTTLTTAVKSPPMVEDAVPLEPLAPSAGLEPSSYMMMCSLAIVAVMLSQLVLSEEKVVDTHGIKVVDLATTAPHSLELLSRPHANYANSRENSRVSLASNGSAFWLFAPASAFRDGRMSDSRLTRSPGAYGSNADAGSVVRSASKVVTSTTKSQLRELINTIYERPVQFLIIYSFASLFHQTYLFNGINYKAFNVRTRGLNCFMYWVGRIPASMVHGHMVDDLRFSSRSRAMHAFSLLVFYVAACQSLAALFWVAISPGVFDVVVDPANTALAFLSFFLYGGLDTVSQTYILWIFSCLAQKHPTRVPHYVAAYRCFQSFGSTLAWALDLNSLTTYRTQFIVCACCWLAAVPGLWWVIWSLPDNDGRGWVTAPQAKIRSRDASFGCGPAMTESAGLAGSRFLWDDSTQPSEFICNILPLPPTADVTALDAGGQKTVGWRYDGQQHSGDRNTGGGLRTGVSSVVNFIPSPGFAASAGGPTGSVNKSGGKGNIGRGCNACGNNSGVTVMPVTEDDRRNQQQHHTEDDLDVEVVHV